MKPTFDTYFNYSQLTSVLSALAAEHPSIMVLGTLGKSHEGRDIPLVILTNQGYRRPTWRSRPFMSTPISMRPN